MAVLLGCKVISGYYTPKIRVCLTMLNIPPIIENRLEEGFRVTVRDTEWKLIVNPGREDELYNIKKDPM